MFQWIIGAIIGPFLSAGVDVAKAKIMQDGTVDEHTANMAIETLRANTAERQYQAAVLVAEQGSWFTRNVRPYLALTLTAPVVKLAVWDKALGQWTNGTSDPLSADMWSLVYLVVGAYFGGRTLEKITSMVTSRGKK